MAILQRSVQNLLVVPVIGASFAFLSFDEVTCAEKDHKQSTDATLDIRNVGKDGVFVRVKLPKNTQPNDKLVLVYVDPKGGKKPEEILIIPEGKIDEAIKETLKMWNSFGLEEVELHQPGSSFSNGTFDVVAASNSQK